VQINAHDLSAANKTRRSIDITQRPERNIMDHVLLSKLETMGRAISGWTGLISASTALLSFRMARSLYGDAKSDERLIVGTPTHPQLSHQEDANAVLQLPVFNKSKRKAYINDVRVYGRDGLGIAVTWSEAIDKHGKPLLATGLVGIVDSATIYVRRDDGLAFEFARIRYGHSFGVG
jgi:hypothetical protein